MKEYKVLTLDKPDWSALPCAEISEYVWGGEYRPEAKAQVYLGNDGSLNLKMTCREQNPKAVHFTYDEEVWLDSCMEFFFGFEKGGKYINCEINSVGAAKIGVGDGREDRQGIDTITKIPEIKAEITETEWSVEAVFTREILEAVFGSSLNLEKGAEFYGNFFKVGEETHTPHYGMWNPIVWEIPDFHRPECFGKFIVE